MLTKDLDKDNDIKPILVTAEGGYGKTSFSKEIFRRSCKQFQNNDQNYLPFLIQLSNYGSIQEEMVKIR